MDIFIISISTVVLLILISFRKPIYLKLLKIIYGEFSYAYIMKYKKFTNKKPHAYCFKDDFYYHILAVKNALNCKIKYHAKETFSFDGLDFSKDFKQILNENGEPDCFTLSSEKDIPLKVVGYKSRMFHSNEKTLHYFCNQNYFMGEYVFSSLADDTAELILGTIKKEFNLDVKAAKNFTIIDPKGNHLFYTDTGFFLSLKFFSANNKTIQSIREFIDQTEENKSNVLSTFGGLNC